MHNKMHNITIIGIIICIIGMIGIIIGITIYIII